MMVAVSENSSDSKGKGQILSSQQPGSSDKVTIMAFKCFLTLKMLMPSGVWVAFTVQLSFGKSFVSEAYGVPICKYWTWCYLLG